MFQTELQPLYVHNVHGLELRSPAIEKNIKKLDRGPRAMLLIIYTKLPY